MRIRVFIDEQEVNDPNNLQGLEVELNFDQDDPRAEISITDWEFGVGDQQKTNDAAVMANKHLTDGLTNGIGVFEGKPLRVELEYKGTIVTLFNGYLDLSKATYACNLVTSPSVVSGGIDWLRDMVDSFTFEYLYSIGVLKPSDNISVPYIINTVPDAQNTIITTLGLFVVINEIKDQIQSLAEYVSAAANPFTANIIISVILRVAYIVVLLVAIIKFVNDLFDLIIQPVKYHSSMYVLRQFQAGCEHLGLKFKSSILENAPWNEFALMPEKFNNKINTDRQGLFGFIKADKTQQPGYYKGTGGTLFRNIKTMFNGKFILKNGELRLERRDFNPSTPQYKLPPVEMLTFTLNAEELKSNILVSFLTDINDKNTIQQYEGTSIQVQTVPVKFNNKQNLLLRGLDQRQIPFSLCKVKTELTFPEKVFDGFFKVIGGVLGELIKVVNKLIKAINKLIEAINKIIKALDVIGIEINFELKPLTPLQAPAFTNLISNRIGMVLLENDIVAVTKALIVGNNADPKYNKPRPHNSTFLNAVYLYDNFHFIDSFVPREGFENANQFLNYEVTVPFVFDEFLQVFENNMLTTSEEQARDGKIKSVKWNFYKQSARIRFGINQLYTNNLKEVKLIPSGK